MIFLALEAVPLPPTVTRESAVALGKWWLFMEPVGNCTREWLKTLPTLNCEKNDKKSILTKNPVQVIGTATELTLTYSVGETPWNALAGMHYAGIHQKESVNYLWYVRAKIRLEFWYCTFFVFTILNFPHIWEATLSREKAREIQNNVNKKWTISDFWPFLCSKKITFFKIF